MNHKASSSYFASGFLLLLSTMTIFATAKTPVYHSLIDVKAYASIPEISQKDILVENRHGNMTGATSIRFDRDKEKNPNPYSPEGVTIFADHEVYPYKINRDRDLGQTFISPDKKSVIEKIYLRVGPNPVKEQTPGARIVIQFFRIEGTPVLNDHGTPGKLSVFDRLRAPEMDDYLEGETYIPLFAVTGQLPETLKTLDYLEFSFKGKAKLKTEPAKSYAFLIMFADQAEENRGLTFFNQYWGQYTPDPSNPLIGHGIRREGTPSFPTDLSERLKMQPTTFGFPDVCTFRDLFFIITGK